MDAVLNATIAKDTHFETLRAYPNVVGADVGFREHKGQRTDEIAVNVFVHRKVPLAALPYWAALPTHVSGIEPVRLDVVETEPTFAFQDTTRYRPVQPGCSIGHQALTDAGTLGGWAGDTTDNTIVLLTCNHVAANIDVAPPTTGHLPARPTRWRHVSKRSDRNAQAIQSDFDHASATLFPDRRRYNDDHGSVFL